MSSSAFRELRAECDKLFVYGCEVDSWLIEMILLPYISLSWKQLPVWIRVIAPPSSGKSAHFGLIQSYDSTYVIDDFTSKSFVSGFRGNNEDPSQLPQMHQKVLLISDESTIMEQRKEERNLIQAILRKAYDGTVIKAFGNLKERVKHKAEFNILIASTPIVDRYYLYSQALGERFINFRLQVPDRNLIAEKALYNQSHGYRPKHQKLARRVRSYLDKIINRKFGSISLTPKMLRKLVETASFISLIRTHVSRDGTGRFVTLLPQPEVASRLVQQMTQVLVGNVIIVGDTKARACHLEKAVYTALCSAPSLTIYILFILWNITEKTGKKWHSIKDLMMATHLGQMSTRNVIEDLCIHRVLKMKKGRSQGGRLIEYALSEYGASTIKSVDLFKHYDHGMGPTKVRGKDRRRQL